VELGRNEVTIEASDVYHCFFLSMHLVFGCCLLTSRVLNSDKGCGRRVAVLDIAENRDQMQSMHAASIAVAL
jgi:hypothetical protein